MNEFFKLILYDNVFIPIESSLCKSTLCLNIKLIVWLILFEFHSTIFLNVFFTFFFLQTIF